jgi:micrococcal nuclease
MVSTFPPDVKHADDFLGLERLARQDGIGMWGLAPEPGSGSECDPSYPTVCIPSLPADLDCGDIQYRRFEVLPPDRHGFDGNKDGVGCQN